MVMFVRDGDPMRSRLTGVLAALSASATLLVTSGAGVAASLNMATGPITSQPIGHYEFSKVHAAECTIFSTDTGPSRLTGSLWRAIKSVNASVNRAVTPMNDFELYGKDEVWDYPKGAGDCEDYVLEKRRKLNAAGLPLSNLLITVVRKPDGEGHAVLTVRTDKGDFILDNLSDQVRIWTETGYRYLKRQASTDTGRWVTIESGASSAVAAVR